MNYVLDTNILIYYLAREPQINEFFSKLDIEEDQLYYSVITGIELLGFPDLTTAETVKIKELLGQFHKIDLTSAAESQTINIKTKQRVKIPDAIIAASTQITNSILVTRNVDDFKKIDGLTILNPFEQSISPS